MFMFFLHLKNKSLLFNIIIAQGFLKINTFIKNFLFLNDSFETTTARLIFFSRAVALFIPSILET